MPENQESNKKPENPVSGINNQNEESDDYGRNRRLWIGN